MIVPRTGVDGLHCCKQDMTGVRSGVIGPRTRVEIEEKSINRFVRGS